MSLEQQVIDLTQATEQLLQAVNTRKVDLDTAETNAALSAQAAATEADEAAAQAELAQKWAQNPEDEPVIEGETPEANEYSALHWAAKAEISQGIAGSYATSAIDAKNAAQTAANNAVAVVTGGTASLTPAAGKIPIAGASGKIDTEWLDPLPGVTAAALHRSPNAVTAMFVYDTSKDSDGGAWTEKCQHTSWYNEPINGKWLGAQASEVAARAVSGATTGDYYQSTTDGRFYRLWKNLVQNGGDLTQSSWVKSALTASVSVIAPPSGVLSGVTSLVANATNAVHKVVATVPYFGIDGSASFYVRANGGRYFGVRTNSTSPKRYAFFDLQNPGTVTRVQNSTADFSTATLTDVGGGWFRVTVSQAFMGGASANNLVIYTLGSQPAAAGGFNEATLAYTGDGTSGIFVAGVQAEFSLIPTAYEAKAADGSTTEVFRGNKRDFPKLAGIVAEASNVNIYDLTEPGRPMFARFTNVSGNAITGNVSTLFAQNGIVAVGSPSGVFEIAFPKDASTQRNVTSYYLRNSNIAARNAAASFSDLGVAGKIANSTVNSIAMTVLPDAPVDPVTGLRMPTIAVATGGGVSVIKHDGKVANGLNSHVYLDISLTKDILLLTRSYFAERWYALNPGSLSNGFALKIISGTSGEFTRGNNVVGGLLVPSRSELLRRSTTAATVQKLKNFEADPAKSLAATITNTFNTGWMTSAVRRCFLSDTEVGAVSYVEKVINGTFASADNWTLTEGNGGSITGGVLRLVSVPSSANSVADQTSWTLDGSKLYRVVITISGYVSGQVFVHVSGAAWGAARAANGTFSQVLGGMGGSYIRIFAAPGTTLDIETLSIEEIVVSDRSYKASGASINGTLTRTQLASGTSLVGYSGFSAANYLREPYSADLDFGTDAWSVGAWVNVPATLPIASFPAVGNELVTNGTFDTDTVWSKTAGATIADGKLTLTTTGTTDVSATQNMSVVSGKTYRLTVEILTNSGAYAEGLVWSNSGGAPVINLKNYAPGIYSFLVTMTYTGNISFGLVNYSDTPLTVEVGSVSFKEVSPALIADRAHVSGPRIQLGSTGGGRLTATAFDGTTTRTVTTPAAYNTATWLNARADYTTDGKLSIKVNGVEVASTTGTPLLSMNNPDAVLTIGNSYALDAPFHGSIALLKLSATVPTPEQSVWMYEQEKHLFRDGAQCCLPDGGAIVDLSYDDATDTWIAASATNVSEWSGLVRTSVTPAPAGSYSKLAAASGVKLQARTTTSPGVDVTIPSYKLREELVRRAEDAAKRSKEIVPFDFDTTAGQTEFALPVGYTTKAVYVDGAAKRQGSTKDYTLLFDGFKETVKFAVAPATAAWVQIHAIKE